MPKNPLGSAGGAARKASRSRSNPGGPGWNSRTPAAKKAAAQRAADVAASRARTPTAQAQAEKRERSRQTVVQDQWYARQAAYKKTGGKALKQPKRGQRGGY